MEKKIIEPNQEFSRVVMLGFNHMFPGDGFTKESPWGHLGLRLVTKNPLEVMETICFSYLGVTAPSEDLVSIL